MGGGANSVAWWFPPPWSVLLHLDGSMGPPTLADPWSIGAPHDGFMGSSEVGGKGPPRAPSFGYEAPFLFLPPLLLLFVPLWIYGFDGGYGFCGEADLSYMQQMM
jgi:hypothetical protein